ncbi:MAG: ATP cone domain-containing protein [Patescibacteria group bacterium]|nr:ATP cone domain-containing protein [Actinomycetota bacterium]MCL5438923.1 ATP cone domain-containing protein [Patescibacteria group bacterium]
MIYVIKANGEKEPFSEQKVRSSIARAGIPENLRDQVIGNIKKKLRNNISTSEIYSQIVGFLEKSQIPYASAKYGLKQAIMSLGPTGFPFEDFISKILEAQGFQTIVRKILQGKCISHEIDVLAEKTNEKIMVEVKYHNLPGTRSDIHVAMYTKARFDDVKEKNKLSNVFLITNTKVTGDSITYGSCVGMKIISWSYPNGESLRDLVEKFDLIPITVLSSLSGNQKQELLKNHIVLCKDIVSDSTKLGILDLSENKIQQIISEAKSVSDLKRE